MLRRKSLPNTMIATPVNKPSLIDQCIIGIETYWGQKNTINMFPFPRSRASLLRLWRDGVRSWTLVRMW
jgi:hypothetical protein